MWCGEGDVDGVGVECGYVEWGDVGWYGDVGVVGPDGGRGGCLLYVVGSRGACDEEEWHEEWHEEC